VTLIIINTYRNRGDRSPPNGFLSGHKFRGGTLYSDNVKKTDGNNPGRHVFFCHRLDAQSSMIHIITFQPRRSQNRRIFHWIYSARKSLNLRSLLARGEKRFPSNFYDFSIVSIISVASLYEIGICIYIYCIYAVGHLYGQPFTFTPPPPPPITLHLVLAIWVLTDRKPIYVPAWMFQYKKATDCSIVNWATSKTIQRIEILRSNSDIVIAKLKTVHLLNKKQNV